MSLDKAIQSGKEWRKLYRGSKAVSPRCRNKTCIDCARKYNIKQKRYKLNTIDLLAAYHDYLNGDDYIDYEMEHYVYHRDEQ